jgi:hypothetical protein
MRKLRKSKVPAASPHTGVTKIRVGIEVEESEPMMAFVQLFLLLLLLLVLVLVREGRI